METYIMSRPEISPLNECLACGSENLKLTLDLGKQPLANSFKNSKNEVQPEYPLAINRCCDCYHVQLTHAVDPDLMFKNYLYVSGTSQTMKEHFKWFSYYARETFEHVTGRKPKNVLDIGCNDGSQLGAFPANIETYGVDPAENLAEISGKRHKVYVGYFDTEYVKFANTIPPYGKYDILIAQNVFAHNPNPIEFLQTASSVMDFDSLLFIQTSQADMIKNNEFDTIYHEHISFYNIQSMNELCRRTGMHLVDVTKCPLHGNSYIFILSKNIFAARPEHISNLIAMERKEGLYSESTYIKYEKRVKELAKELKNRVEFYQRNEIGYLAIGYGAAAKGMTLLNYTGLKLDYIIDDNPLKQGKFTPGSSIPIYSSDKLLEESSAQLFVPLAWNFFEEITDKIYNVRKNDYDLFVKYFPQVRIYRKNEIE